MPTVVPPSPGKKASEFLLITLAALVPMVGEIAKVVPHPWGVIAMTVVSAIYTVARTYLKAKGVVAPLLLFLAIGLLA